MGIAWYVRSALKRLNLVSPEQESNYDKLNRQWATFQDKKLKFVRGASVREESTSVESETNSQSEKSETWSSLVEMHPVRSGSYTTKDPQTRLAYFEMMKLTRLLDSIKETAKSLSITAA